jgi:hypothetical protein
MKMPWLLGAALLLVGGMAFAINSPNITLRKGTQRIIVKRGSPTTIETLRALFDDVSLVGSSSAGDTYQITVPADGTYSVPGARSA